MRRTLHTYSFLTLLIFCGCGTSKIVSQTPKPTYNITYKLITNTDFTHLDASYLDKSSVGVRKKDIVQRQVDVPIGLVRKGFVASISSTGYGAKDSLASIELQIFKNDSLVVSDIALGRNPSLAVSYVVE